MQRRVEVARRPSVVVVGCACHGIVGVGTVGWACYAQFWWGRPARMAVVLRAGKAADRMARQG